MKNDSLQKITTDKVTKAYTLAWIGGMPIAIINGSLRNFVY